MKFQGSMIIILQIITKKPKSILLKSGVSNIL